MSAPVTIEATDRSVTVRLPGDLEGPDPAAGLVLFAHGSGSSRHSPRNRAVAEILQQRGFATLLFDLLTEDEDVTDMRTAELRFDIGLLAQRLVTAVDHAKRWQSTQGMPLGLFGASTGAAAALVAAAERLDLVRAVVSRGGRPDLAGNALDDVHAPTLLLVGGRDEPVLQMNQQAAARLQGEHQVEVIPGASHLFEEPGALEQVAQSAATWFDRYLTVDQHSPPRQPRL